MFEYKQKKDPIQKKKADHVEKHDDRTGIPNSMKLYAEKKFGSSLDDVKVHYNSEKPSRFNALGYTQKNDVYLGPGQEKHLMHELCHVIQQKRGVVKPTAAEGGYAVNDSADLEREAENSEKQYEKEAPVQLLLDQAAQGSATMGNKKLNPNGALRYHTVGYFELECSDGTVIQDSVWSNKESYEKQDKGGDHAEDAICDTIENMKFGDYIRQLLGEASKYKLDGGKLTIWLSSSPCERCQKRINELKQYNLQIKVIAAKPYGGNAGGGAGNAENAEYDLEILSDEEKEELLQF